MIKDFLYLYPSCIPIKGFSRSSIEDCSTGKYLFIPNSLCFDLMNNNHMLLDIQMKEHQSFLIKNSMAFMSSVPLPLNRIEYSYDYPAHITNAIVCASAVTIPNIICLVENINKLGCEALQLYINNDIDINKIVELLEFLKNSSYTTITIIISYDLVANQIFICKDWLENEDRIKNILVHKSPFSKRTTISKFSKKSIVFTSECITYLSSCGFVHPYIFTINLPFFTEAQHHNTCLNRKICIDENGDIKNCPAMEKSYGNIRDTTLKEAIEKPGFKECWTICKDQIDVCKDCEFRYMCTDCRAFIKDPENPYSQPAKCTYNPYICLWEGQAGYVPVEECGTYSRETGFVPDREKIARLNKQIWGEE